MQSQNISCKRLRLRIDCRPIRYMYIIHIHEYIASFNRGFGSSINRGAPLITGPPINRRLFSSSTFPAVELRELRIIISFERAFRGVEEKGRIRLLVVGKAEKERRRGWVCYARISSRGRNCFAEFGERAREMWQKLLALG